MTEKDMAAAEDADERRMRLLGRMIEKTEPMFGRDRGMMWRYVNAGIAGVLLMFGGHWVSQYLDREQVIRAEQAAALMAKIDALSANIQTLALEIRESRKDCP